MWEAVGVGEIMKKVVWNGVKFREEGRIRMRGG